MGRWCAYKAPESKVLTCVLHTLNTAPQCQGLSNKIFFLMLYLCGVLVSGVCDSIKHPP